MKLKLDITRVGELVTVKILHQDKSIRRTKGGQSIIVYQNKSHTFSISSFDCLEAYTNGLYLHGADKDEHSSDVAFRDEQSAIDYCEKLKEALEVINGKATKIGYGKYA